MKRRFSELYLNAITGFIALGILAFAVHALWADCENAWREAGITSKNILMALTRDIGNNVSLLDLSLKGVVDGLRYRQFNNLPPEVQHRMLFDRATSASFVGTILLINENGDLIADGGAVIAPRPMNFSDREFFTARKDHSFLGLYLSRPHVNSFGTGRRALLLAGGYPILMGGSSA
jgi:hypothetical protein